MLSTITPASAERNRGLSGSRLSANMLKIAIWISLLPISKIIGHPFPMKLLLPIFCCLVFCTSAFGRLGETRSEIVARFGTPDGKSNEPPFEMFSKNGFSISVTFINGRSAEETYFKVGIPSRPLSPSDIEALLKANSSGQQWSKEPAQKDPAETLWTRTDGATAEELANFLTFKSKEFVEAEARKKAELFKAMHPATSTDGF